MRKTSGILQPNKDGKKPHLENYNLKQFFRSFGQVIDAYIIMDQVTRHSCSFDLSNQKGSKLLG